MVSEFEHTEYHMRQKKRKGREPKLEIKNKTNPILIFTALCLRWCQITSDSGLSAEEVEGHCRKERWDALLVMQMKGHHLVKSFGELCLHELHASIGALFEEQGVVHVLCID